MENYFAVVHLALGIAALVPLLWPGGRERLKAVWIGSLSLMLLLALYQGILAWKSESELATTRRDILVVLKNKTAMTSEQICDDCYRRDFAAVERALRGLVEEGVVEQSKVRIMDREGNNYVVRLFSLLR